MNLLLEKSSLFQYLTDIGVKISLDFDDVYTKRIDDINFWICSLKIKRNNTIETIEYISYNDIIYCINNIDISTVLFDLFSDFIYYSKSYKNFCSTTLTHVEYIHRVVKTNNVKLRNIFTIDEMIEIYKILNAD